MGGGIWKDGTIHSVGVSGSSTGCDSDGADCNGGGDVGGDGDGDGGEDCEDDGEGGDNGFFFGCGSCCGNGDSSRRDGNSDGDSLILQYKMDEAMCEATKEET